MPNEGSEEISLDGCDLSEFPDLTPLVRDEDAPASARVAQVKAAMRRFYESRKYQGTTAKRGARQVRG